MKLIEQIQSLDFSAPLPGMLLQVRQRIDAPRVADVAAATRDALQKSGLLARVRPGERVAVGVGSRGIANLPVIVQATVETLRAAGASPFVMPAMGSHGGASVQGQVALLAELGVTPGRVGVEIKGTMEVRPIGSLPEGPTLYQDVVSSSADHVLLISRIKPHTDFHGELESGPSKMSVIGLGKQRGALAMHSYGGAGFIRWLASAARVYETHSNLLGAVGIVENACEETAEIAGLTAAEIGTEKEKELLQRARALMPSLPFPAIDVLVIREIGKNISGTGMDTNIVNRIMIPRQPESRGVDIAAIAVLDLTEQTEGNASGIGLANVTTQRVADKTDWVATYTNAFTSGVFGMFRAALPMTMPDDRRALQVAVHGCGRPLETARWVFIENTLKLDQLWVSETLRPQVEEHPRLEVVSQVPLAFDSAGTLTSPWHLETGTRTIKSCGG
jgi:hypothetical protein